MQAYLNQVSMINALGSTRSEILSNLLNNAIEHNKARVSLFSHRSTYVNRVNAKLPSLANSELIYQSRNNQLLAAAYQGIAEEVKQFKATYGKNRIGIVLGTSTSGISNSELAMAHYQQKQNFSETFHYSMQEPSNGSAFLADYADITGIHYTISTACSSSGKAIAAGLRLLLADLCDAVIVGGSDSLCELTLNGFDALNLVDENLCQPFSKNRRGLNLGEGAALFLLSKEAAPIALYGVGETTDGHHISTPDPTGQAAILAMQQAFNQAAISPDDIGYVNLHGTGTQINDLTESKIMQHYFTDKTPCSSTKPLTGHTLGAASATELGLCWLLLSDDNPKRLLPAHVWDKVIDPELSLLGLIQETTEWHKPYFMSNSFAFGGSNVSLIIGRGNA